MTFFFVCSWQNMVLRMYHKIRLKAISNNDASLQSFIYHLWLYYIIIIIIIITYIIMLLLCSPLSFFIMTFIKL